MVLHGHYSLTLGKVIARDHTKLTFKIAFTCHPNRERHSLMVHSLRMRAWMNPKPFCFVILQTEGDIRHIITQYPLTVLQTYLQKVLSYYYLWQEEKLLCCPQINMTRGIDNNQGAQSGRQSQRASLNERPLESKGLSEETAQRKRFGGTKISLKSFISSLQEKPFGSLQTRPNN